MNDLKIKLTFEVCELCKRALMRVHELTLAKRAEANSKANLISADSDFKAMHDRMCILTMELSWAQALILGSAVRSYMENVLREGSRDYKRGQDLMAALSDYSDTHMADSVEKENAAIDGKELAEKIRKYAGRETAKADAEEWTRKRDRIFRGMVESVNVWGDIVTDTYIDPVVRPNPGSFPPGVYTMPLADAEVDQDLTNGEPIAFNERMKKEGVKPNRSEGAVANFKEMYGGDPRPANTVDDARKKGYIA